MKKLLLLIIAIAFSFGAKAQLDSFDISKFILPDLKIRSNEFNLGFNGNGAETHLKNLFEEEGKSSSFNSVLNLAMVWDLSENTMEYQKGYDLRLNFSPNFQLHKESGDDMLQEDRFRLPLYLSGNYFKRNFYKAKSYFQFSFPFSSNNSFDYLISKDDANESKSKYLNLGLDFAPEFLIGFGRIENVGPAWHAIRILEDLDRFNRLSKDVNPIDILQLANLIAERKYTRYYDSRLKTMEDLEILDSKLAELGLLKDRDIRTFNSLLDMWFYGTNATRLSGKALAFGLVSELSFNGHFIDSDYARGYGGIGLKVEQVYHKPLSQEIQFDAVLSISSIYLMQTDFNKETDDLENSFKHGFTANITLGWFPDTRTYFRSSLEFQISNKPIYYLNIPSLFDGIYSRSRWSNTLSYYVSPRIRLSSNIVLDHYYLNDKYDSDILPGTNYYHNGFNYMFNFGYSYMIY